MKEVATSVSTETEPILRTLTASERWFMFVDRNRPFHFSLTAEITGRTTPAMWREALDQLQDRHPLLRVCVEQNDDSLASFRQIKARRIPLTVFRRTAPMQWLQESQRQISQRFNPSVGPLLRAFLWQGDDQCDITLWAYHAIADGMAMAFLISDLLAAMAGRMLPPLPVPLSQEARFALLEEPPPPATPETPVADEVPSPREWKARYQPADCGLTIDAMRLTRQQTTDLVDAARHHGTTVHAAILAAVVLAGRSSCPQWQEGGVRVSSPISLRRILAIDDDCVVAQTAGVIFLNPTPDTQLWDLARTGKQLIRPWDEQRRIAAVLDFFKEATSDFAAFSKEAEGGGCDLLLTNLGRMPYANRFGDLTIEAIWGPMVNQGYEGEQVVGVTTVNGVLCLTHTTDRPIESLLENSVALLMNACGMPVRV